MTLQNRSPFWEISADLCHPSYPASARSVAGADLGAGGGVEEGGCAVKQVVMDVSAGSWFVLAVASCLLR